MHLKFTATKCSLFYSGVDVLNSENCLATVNLSHPPILQKFIYSTQLPLTHWPLGDTFKSIIFKLIIQNSSLCPHYEITIKWTSTLGHVMAWCRQATSHYMNCDDPDVYRHMASLGHTKSRNLSYKKRERERLSLSAFLRAEDIGVHIVHISRLIITYTLE